MIKNKLENFNYGNEARNKDYRYFVKSLYEMGFNPIELGVISEDSSLAKWCKAFKNAYDNHFFVTNCKGDVAKMHYYEGLSNLLIAYIATRNGRLFVA
jgi:hypothetical protein